MRHTARHVNYEHSLEVIIRVSLLLSSFIAIIVIITSSLYWVVGKATDVAIKYENKCK